MFPQLLKNKRVLKDLEIWRSKINSLESSEAKLKGEMLLEEFIKYARKIDIGHDVSYSGNVRPARIRDDVASLYAARVEIQKFIKDIPR